VAQPCPKWHADTAVNSDLTDCSTACRGLGLAALTAGKAVTSLCRGYYAGDGYTIIQSLDDMGELAAKRGAQQQQATPMRRRMHAVETATRQGCRVRSLRHKAATAHARYMGAHLEPQCCACVCRPRLRAVHCASWPPSYLQAPVVTASPTASMAPPLVIRIPSHSSPASAYGAKRLLAPHRSSCGTATQPSAQACHI